MRLAVSEIAWLETIQDRAQSFVFLSYLSDRAVFCYTPSEIALAVIVQSFKPIKFKISQRGQRYTENAANFDKFISKNSREVEQVMIEFIQWFYTELFKQDGETESSSNGQVRLKALGAILDNVSDVLNSGGEIETALKKLRKWHKLKRKQ